MMTESKSRRGYMPSDQKEFVQQISTLRKAAKDVRYLLEEGYPMKTATTFVGNHYLLSERQRLALARSLTTEGQAEKRRAKELQRSDLTGRTVSIDGFNTIISLEIAFSGSTLLCCMDGTVRDLAGLRGNYRIIDKTTLAIRAIRNELAAARVSGAVVYLDAPVSNSGRLKEKIAEEFEGSGIDLDIQVVCDVDRILMASSCVVTSDAVILDACESWYNLTVVAIEREIGSYPFVRVLGEREML